MSCLTEKKYVKNVKISIVKTGHKSQTSLTCFHFSAKIWFDDSDRYELS